MYLGRVIEAKGVHHAIAAVKEHNQRTGEKVGLKIAGKHYAGHDDYFENMIEPELGNGIEYVGHLKTKSEVQDLLGNARGVLMPSVFSEPFGIVATEALACGTPVIGLESGALPEIIETGQTSVQQRRSGRRGVIICRGKPEKPKIPSCSYGRLDSSRVHRSSQ